MNPDKLFDVAVFAIIFDEQGRILLAHRTDGDIWNLVGGGLEIGETPEEAIVREIKEEIGVEAVAERLVGIYTKTDRKVLLFSFICRIISGELTISSEANKIEFFQFPDIPHNISPGQVERIHDALVKNPTSIVYSTITHPNVWKLLKEGNLEQYVNQLIQKYKNLYS